MHTETRERFQKMIFGIQHVDRERCEKALLRAHWEDAIGILRRARDQQGNAARRGHRHRAGKTLGSGSFRHCAGESRFGLKQARDTRGVEEDSRFCDEDSATSARPRRCNRSRREGECYIEQCFSGGALERGRSDANLEFGADCARVCNGAALRYARSESLGRK